jgi:hypothetical protein
MDNEAFCLSKPELGMTPSLSKLETENLKVWVSLPPVIERVLVAAVPVLK